MKKMKRILSATMVLLLMATLPVTAFAQEYDLVKGSIAVTAESDGKQYVSQPDNSIEHEEQTTETIITQTDGDTTATGNTITITAEAEQTAEVTLSGVNIDGWSDRKAAVSAEGAGDVIVELDNENTLKSGGNHAGLEKNNTGELTIADENCDDGSLYIVSDSYGAGIGGGNGKSASNITITGGNVYARSGMSGAGIGGGFEGTGSNIRIWGDAQVTAEGGGEGGVGEGAGASIGNGGHWGSGGEEVTPDTSELTAEGRVNGASGNHVHTWDEGTVIKEPTCTEAGVMTYTCIAGKGFTKTEEIPATGEHTWENGKCSVCGEPQPAPAPVHTQSAPLYRVTDKDDKDISHKAEQKDGVLTITVDADFAILTGKLWGINTLKARGVEKIVFVTKNAKSTFALANLLEKGSIGEAYKLTHDVKTVTFTLGVKNIDVSDILEKA